MVSARMRFAGLALPDWMTRVQSVICSAGVVAASLPHQPSSPGDWASAGAARTAANVRPASRRNVCAMRTSLGGLHRAPRRESARSAAGINLLALLTSPRLRGEVGARSAPGEGAYQLGR